jgi:hypothetical protein
MLNVVFFFNYFYQINQYKLPYQEVLLMELLKVIQYLLKLGLSIFKSIEIDSTLIKEEKQNLMTKTYQSRNTILFLIKKNILKFN